MSSPRPGQIIGDKYRILRIIGEGGMGTVFEAENTALGGHVAIKWLHARMKPSQGVDRLYREARASARVRHPNVVAIYDVGREADSMFLVMELLRGETLAARLERDEVPVATLLSLLIPAMRGTAEAHRQGIIHRDIKPENIFLAQELDRDGPVPKVLDFGIAKMGEIGGGTAPGYTLGTPQFMSLEQLRSVRDLDARADVYGFGVILYLALTGRPPFNAQSIAHLVVTITTTTPVPPHLLAPKLPQALSEAVMRAIAVERAHRTPSLEQLVHELAPFAQPPAARGEREAPRGSVGDAEPGIVSALGVTHRLRLTAIDASGGAKAEPPRALDALTSTTSDAVLVSPLVPTPSAPSRKLRLRIGSGAAVAMLSLAGSLHLPSPLASTAEITQPPAQRTQAVVAPSAQPAAPLPEPAPLPPTPSATSIEAPDAGLTEGAPLTVKPSAPPPAPGRLGVRAWIAAPARFLAPRTTPRAPQPAAPAAAPPDTPSNLTVQDAGVRRGLMQVCDFVGNCPR